MAWNKLVAVLLAILFSKLGYASGIRCGARPSSSSGLEIGMLGPATINWTEDGKEKPSGYLQVRAWHGRGKKFGMEHREVSFINMMGQEIASNIFYSDTCGSQSDERLSRISIGLERISWMTYSSDSGIECISHWFIKPATKGPKGRNTQLWVLRVDGQVKINSKIKQLIGRGRYYLMGDWRHTESGSSSLDIVESSVEDKE